MKFMAMKFVSNASILETLTKKEDELKKNMQVIFTTENLDSLRKKRNGKDVDSAE